MRSPRAGRARRQWPDPSKVFINCPFDEDYAPTFDAIFFSTVCCGFIPCSAFESESVARLRIERIFEGLAGAKYSLHDLCRCHGEGADSLARFNMPLELGIAMALNLQSAGEGHDWAVLVPEGHSHGRFISDLAGHDLLRYDGRPESAIPRVMRWLTSRPDARPNAATPEDVIAALPGFQDRRRKLNDAWHGELPWGRLLEGAIAVAREGKLIG